MAAVSGVAVTIRIMRRSSGEPDYFISVLEDIAERKHAEQLLRASELRFRQVVEAAPYAVVMSESGSGIEMVNAQTEGLFGYKRETLLGQDSETLIPQRFRALYRRLRDECLANPVSGIAGSGRSFIGIRQDGSEFPVEIGLTRIQTGQGRMLLTTLIDLTERRQQESALRQIEDQLRQSQKMEAIGNLTGGMAHDFNNLLGVIIGNLDLASPAVGQAGDAGGLVNEALDAALRGADLTHRLLAFARRQPLHPRRVALNDLVSGITRLLERTLGENIRIVLALTEDVWPVIVDASQVEAALTNLATNARDAMPSGGVLRIATANRRLDADYAALQPDVALGDYAVIEVSDTGTGMPPEIVARIFEPFFTTKGPAQGTGLGLSMIFGFMKQSGGHINVYSEPNTGSTFRLFLPRADADTGEEPAQEAPAPVRGGGETVLIVEDNEALRRLVIRQVTELGYHVMSARSAVEALAILERETIDLLFTDIVMPGAIDGFGLERHVRAHWPDTKVVLTSGFPDARISADAGEAAVSVRILSKPYRKVDLARVMSVALAG